MTTQTETQGIRETQDQAPIEQVAREPPARGRGLKLFAGCLMAFAIASHIYVMRTVMPDVIHSFDTTVGPVQLILVYITLVAAAFVPTSRNLAQILGAKRLFTLGLLAFVAGIVVTARSSGVVTLMLGYSVIGGLAISALVSVYWGWVTRQARGWRGIVDVVLLGLYAQMGALLGPPIGGLIATRSGWQRAFLPQAGMALLVLLIVLFLPRSERRRGVTVDWLGPLLAVLGLGALLLGLSLTSQYGWRTPQVRLVIGDVVIPPYGVAIVPLSIGAGVLLSGGAIYWEWRKKARGQPSSWRAGLFRRRTFAIGLATAALFTVATSGMTQSLYVHLPSALGLNSFLTAIALLPYYLSSLIVMLVTFWLGLWIAPRYVVQAGLVLLGLGLYLLYTTVDPNLTADQLRQPLIVMGVGAGLVAGQIGAFVISIAGAGQRDEASGLYSVFRDVGRSLGWAVFGTLLISLQAPLIVEGVLARLGRESTPRRVQEATYHLQQALWTFSRKEVEEALATWPPEAQEALAEIAMLASVDAMHVTVLALIGVVVAALVVSFALPRTKMAWRHRSRPQREYSSTYNAAA